MGDHPKALRTTAPAPAGGFALGYWADELRHHREAAGLSRGRLARLINSSESQVAMVESRERAPRPGFIAACDEALETGGALARLWRRVIESAHLDWFRPFTELEARATSMLTFDPQVVPGLLRTEEYARALLRAGRPRDTGEQIEQYVAATLHRQAVLERERPPLLWAVLDEALLHRPVGGWEVMRRQLLRLLETGRSRHVVLQVIPFEVGAHAEMAGARTILRFPDRGDVVYVEGADSGHFVEELDEVAECALRFDLLRAEALSPAKSAALIREAIGEG